MTKTILSLAVVAVIVLTACQKENADSILKSSFQKEISNESANLLLPVSGFETNIAEALTLSDNYEFYTSGKMEYKQNGSVLATVDFGDGEKDALAYKTQDGEDKEIDLTQGAKNAKDFAYKKVIIKPLVKTEDCDWIVSGIIKYFKEKQWVATIDFGDGTCDEWAVKITDDGTYTFSIDDFVK